MNICRERSSLVWTLMVLVLCAGTAHAEFWTTYQHDDAHTGRSVSSYDVTTLTKAWSAPQGYSTPLVVGDSVYAMRNQQGIGGDVTSVSSFQLINGLPNWTFTGHFVFPGQPTVADGLVVFAASATTGPGSLYVLDAATGAQKYTVTLSGIGVAPLMPTVARNASNQLVAYVSDHDSDAAVNLGQSSGSVLWTGAGSFGGASIPTVVGNSVVLAGPGQFYAFDELTGARNHFLSSSISGGGGTTVAFDAQRDQFYVLEDTGSRAYDVLTAFSYTNNSNINQVWQKTGAGLRSGASVTIGADGGVYSVSSTTLVERDPRNGEILRSLTGLNIASGVTPALSSNAVFLYTDSSTQIYDLATLSLRKTLPGSRGSLNSAYDGPGAIFDQGFALDYGTIYGRPGFDTYLIPERSSWILALIGVVVPSGWALIVKVVRRS